MVASHRLNGDLSKSYSEVKPPKGNAHIVKHTGSPATLCKGSALKKLFGTGEVALGLRAPPTLPETLSSIASIHMAA